MIKKFTSILFLASALPALAEKAPDSVVQLSKTLGAWGTDSVIISAVRDQNASGLTLEQIKSRDAEWRQVEGLDAQMESMLANPASKQLSSFEQSAPYFFELFLMDDQGANVAMTNKTSDYWQGDEAKWRESFKAGTGAIHIGDVEFDESAQNYLVQISIPVMDDGKAIGAMTIGVNIDELEAQ